MAVLKDTILRMNSNLSMCHAQCYDGAANVKRIAHEIKAIEPMALCLYYYGHSLNLAAADTLQEVKPMADTLQEVKPTADTLQEVKPTVDTLQEVKPTADTLQEVKPTADTLQEVKPTADTLQEVKPTADTLQEVKPTADTLQEVKPTADTLDYALEIRKLLKFSSRRDAIFNKLKQEITPNVLGLCTLGPTHWTVCAASLESIHLNYPTLMATWEEALRVELTA